MLPALIRKAHEARENGLAELTIWGSGSPRREFLHVDDCADALVLLLKVYSAAEHVNVGSGEDLTIRELAELVARVVGFAGRVVTTDPTKPDGDAAEADERRAPCGARLAAENRAGGRHPRNLPMVPELSSAERSTLKASEAWEEWGRAEWRVANSQRNPWGRGPAMAKILIYAMNYSPEVAGVGRYTGEIGEHFAAMGHEVAVVTTIPHYPGWKASPPYRNGRYCSETRGGVTIVRCPLVLRERMGGIWRFVAPLSFALMSAPVALWRVLRHRPDIVLCVEPTLMSAPVAVVAARLVGARSVLHVQDLEVDASFAVGHLAESAWLKRLARASWKRDCCAASTE